MKVFGTYEDDKKNEYAGFVIGTKFKNIFLTQNHPEKVFEINPKTKVNRSKASFKINVSMIEVFAVWKQRVIMGNEALEYQNMVEAFMELH